jgi:hypothetical protein
MEMYSKLSLFQCHLLYHEVEVTVTASYYYDSSVYMPSGIPGKEKKELLIILKVEAKCKDKKFSWDLGFKLLSST